MPLLEAVECVRLEVPIQFVREQRHDALDVCEPLQVCHAVEAQVVPLATAFGHVVESALCDSRLRARHPVFVPMEVPILQVRLVQISCANISGPITIFLVCGTYRNTIQP